MIMVATQRYVQFIGPTNYNYYYLLILFNAIAFVRTKRFIMKATVSYYSSRLFM